MRFSQYLAQVHEGSHPRPDSGVVPRQARRFQGQPAGFASRLLAVIVDVALVYLLMRIIALGLRTLDLVATPWFNLPIPDAQTFAGIGLVTLWAYAAWAWAYLGRTLGDHVMGLRVADQQRDRLGVKRAALRSLACVAFPIGMLWVLVSSKRRSLQDVVLGTDVLYDWVSRVPQPTASPSRLGSADS